MRPTHRNDLCPADKPVEDNPLSIQKVFDNAVSAARSAALGQSDQLTVGELIAKLESLKQDSEVSLDFCGFKPTKPESYRGIYAELAFGYTKERDEPTVAEVIGWLRESIGKTYTGYKGGDFTMGKNTPLWAANNGEAGATAVVGVRDLGYWVIIETGYREAYP